jgi:hypothetical protein
MQERRLPSAGELRSRLAPWLFYFTAFTPIGCFYNSNRLDSNCNRLVSTVLGFFVSLQVFRKKLLFVPKPPYRSG